MLLLLLLLSGWLVDRSIVASTCPRARSKRSGLATAMAVSVGVRFGIHRRVLFATAASSITVAAVAAAFAARCRVKAFAAVVAAENVAALF